MDHHYYLFSLTQIMIVLNSISLFVVIGWVQDIIKGRIRICPKELIENSIVVMSLIVTEMFLLGLICGR